MTTRVLAIPLLATLAAAAAALGPAAPASVDARMESRVDPAWTSRGFAERIGNALDRARSEIEEEPGIAWTDVRIRTRDPHEPLQVAVRIAWGSIEAPEPERLQWLASIVGDWLDDVAEAVVVLTDDRGRTVTR